MRSAPWRTTRTYFLLAIFLTIPFLYFNCSGKFASPMVNSTGGNGGVFSGGTAGNIDIYGAPNTAGPVSTYQDRMITFTPVTSDPGPFSIDTIPTWATFDSATGKLIGSAHLISDNATFKITGSNPANVFGPYQITVIGNPLKEHQWWFRNTGQTAFAQTGGIAGEDMHFNTALLSGFTGIGVRMAFSDSGTVLQHEALAPNVLAGESRNYFNNYNSVGTWLGDPTPNLSEPGLAHGTATASLAVEKGWNGKGGRGAAPDTKFAAFLFVQAQDHLSSIGLASVGLMDQFAGNFDVFNYSWGDPQCALVEYSQSMSDKLYAAVTQQRGGRGSILLMAGGNSYVDDIQSCYPSRASSMLFDNANFSELQTTPYILNIAAVNANGVSSSYSTPGSNLWVSSAGGEYGYDVPLSGVPEASQPALVAADFPGCSLGMKYQDAANSHFDAGASPNQACNYQSTMNGTSGATPIASGVVAMMLQANPNLTWRDVKYILAKTADKVNPGVNPVAHPVSSLNLSGYVYDLPWITNAAGFHFQNYYGFGRINVDAAIAMAQTYVSALGTYHPGSWAYNSGSLNLSIPNNSSTGLSQNFSSSEHLTLEAVQIRVSISGCVGDMGIELTSPSGTKSILMNINSRLQDTTMTDHTFLSNAFYGENSFGTWTMKVVDGNASCTTGKLTNWKMNLAGY